MNKTTKHIGIVGCSAEGAALCYRTICLEGASLLGTHAHPEITMHTHPLSDYMRFLESDDWNGVADLMLSSAQKLKMAGADFLICPDNTIHQAFEGVIKKSPLPWLHIAEEVINEAVEHQFASLGLLGTRYLMEGPVYKNILDTAGIENKIPDARSREEINRIIFDELVNGIITDESQDYFIDVIDQFQKDGCNAVILGCTEIPLIITPENSPLPVLDSTRILARAALKNALI